MATLDFNTHYVPLLKEYTLRLTELFDDVTESKSTIYNKLQNIMTSLSPPLLSLVVTNHVDLVEIILNNLSIDTFERSMTEWSHSCTCIQALLLAGSNFWNIVCYEMSDITDDMLEILSALLPTDTKVSSSKTFSHSAVITAFEVLASLVKTSDDLSLIQTKMLLHLIEEVFKRNTPAPTMVLHNKSDGVMIAISALAQVLVDKERKALISVNISTRQNTSERPRTYTTRKYNIIMNCSFFHSHLCDLVSSALSKSNILDTFQIQSTLLASLKWIGLISEDYLKMTDQKLQTAEYKLLPLVAEQHHSLGNLVASILNHINSAAITSSSRIMSKFKKILSFIPYCLVSFDSHLKSSSLQLFQYLVESLSNRCCYSRSWANPMQVLDPLVDNDSFLAMGVSKTEGGSSVLRSSSSNAFKVILDACITMTEYLDDSINSLSPSVVPPQTSQAQRSLTTGMVLPATQVFSSPLARAASMGSGSPLQPQQPYLAEEMLNALYVNAVAGVFSFYDRLRVILHTTFLHIGSIMTANAHKNPSADDSVIAWQELWCLTLPSWEQHLQHLKLRRSLFKNNIVPEVSSLPAAPHLISKGPPVVDLSQGASLGTGGTGPVRSDPLRDYLKELAAGTSSSSAANTGRDANINKEGNKPLGAGDHVAQHDSMTSRKRAQPPYRPGVIKHLKLRDDTTSSRASSSGSEMGSKSHSQAPPPPSVSSSSSSSTSTVAKKHIIKGGSASLREQLKAREESGLRGNRCGGIEDYGDDFAYEEAGSRRGFRADNGYNNQNQSYQRQSDREATSAWYSKNTTRVTDTYSYSSYRSTGLQGFDDFRKSSKKRGTDSRETSEIIDDFTTKKKFHHVADSLDTFGDFNVGADLDTMDLDLEGETGASSLAAGVSTKSNKTGEKVTKEATGKLTNNVLAAPDITTLLGEYSKAVSSKVSSSTGGKSSGDTSSQPPLLMSQKSIQDANLTMMQKMAHVNIDDFYLRLLKLSLDNNLPSRTDLQTCPVRFMSEISYISLFQPLLEAELDAMLTETIASNCANHRSNERQTKFQASIYGPKSSSATATATATATVVNLPKVYVRCAMIQPRTVSSAVYLNANNSGLQFITNATSSGASRAKNNTASHFTDSFSDASSNLEEVRVAIVASPEKSVQRACGPHTKLTRDDLVVILDSNTVHGALDVNTCSMKELLTLPHCLAVVVSQHSSDRGSGGSSSSSGGGSGGGSGGEEFDQQTLVVLKDATPSSSATWLCVPFVSLSTHTREWKALHSIRSHSLLPLIPYILQASPVISAGRLQHIYRDLERGISGIVQTKSRSEDVDADSAWKAEMATRASSVMQQLEYLDSFGIDGSVLTVTNMPEKLKALQKRIGLKCQPKVISKLKDIHSKWKVAVKSINRSSTLAQLKGGNVITASSLGAGEDLQRPPPLVPAALWKVLARTHNETQLFAIKFVISSMSTGISMNSNTLPNTNSSVHRHNDINDSSSSSSVLQQEPTSRGVTVESDTRICLIQGPPGTGKTRTILAMVSTLLHVGEDTDDGGQTTSRLPLPAAPIKAGLDNTENVSSSETNQVSSNRILVCAPSNAAVDEVLLRLMKEGVVNRDGKLRKPKLVRLGKPLEDSPNEIIDITLENQVEKYLQRDPAWKKLLKAKESMSSLKQQLAGMPGGQRGGSTTTSGGGSVSTEKRRKIRSDLRLALGAKIAAELEVSLRRTALRKSLLETCDVLAGTLSAAGQYTVLDHVKQYDIRFETVLIDEAAQATEPATLIPLRYGCKTLVLVGDPRQLPAYVASRAAEKAGLGKSLFERLEQAGHAVVMLSVQYRMHPSISAFPSKQFYNGNLRDAHRIQMECANTRSGPAGSGIAGSVGEETSSVPPTRSPRSRVTSPLCRVDSPCHFSPVTFFNIQGREESTGKSFRNRVETDFIFSLLSSLRHVPCMKTYKVGILSPYKGQVNLLRSILNPGHRSKNNSTAPAEKNRADLLDDLDIEVNTIDGFQGREKDVIVLSTARCNSRGVGFLSDIRRLNVAITRAKRCLLIVGCANTLRLDPVWQAYLVMLRAAHALVPGPQSGQFQDYQGYAELMTTVRVLEQGNNAQSSITSGTTSAFDSSDRSSGGKKSASGGVILHSSSSHEECNNNGNSSYAASKPPPPVMRRTISMLQQQQHKQKAKNKQQQRQMCAGTTATANLEEGELEDEVSAADVSNITTTSTMHLIGKKKRI